MKCIRCGKEGSVSIVQAPYYTRLPTRRSPEVAVLYYQWYNCSNCEVGWAEGDLIKQHLKVNDFFFGCVWKFRGYASDLKNNLTWRFGQKNEKLLRRLKRWRKRFPPETRRGFPYVYTKERGTLPECFHPISSRNRHRFYAHRKEVK